MRLLLVEDDAMIGRGIRQGLGEARLHGRRGQGPQLEDAPSGGLRVTVCFPAPG